MKKEKVKELEKNMKKNSLKTIDEFKEFINKGNIVDMAVGVIIGGAFGKIVSSLVNDILMPLIGILIGGIDFTSLSITIGSANVMYGTFIQNIIDFLIIAVCVFMFVKVISKFTAKKEEVAEETKKEEISNEEKMVKALEEIKDLMKKSK